MIFSQATNRTAMRTSSHTSTPIIRAYQSSDWDSFIRLEIETSLAGVPAHADQERLQSRWPTFIQTTYGWDAGSFPGPSIGKHIVSVLLANDDCYAGHVWLTEQSDFFTEKTKLFVTTFAVVQNYRRRGFGELLLQHAFDQADSRGISMVALAVDANNAGAIQLYKKMGFQTSRLSMERRTSA